uniref:6-hydroxy-D-nicotine oxidase n=1 Tax=Talaromyces marneffei PM1 TaxID=1077442 RepID=A0A093VYQ9_TALMA
MAVGPVSLTAGSQFRHAVIRYDPTTDTATTSGEDAETTIIKTLQSADSALKIYTRASSHFNTLRETYNTLITAKPLLFIRVTSVEQIQAIVRLYSAPGVPEDIKKKYPLNVRCGGHDVWGRGSVQDSVTIDLRELDTQVLDDTKKIVRVGGGLTSRNFVTFLDTHGLCTANGAAGSVGWIGWSIWGGFGPLNDYTGLGLDNIQGAKIVLANGELVEAGPDLLWGLKGAGGNLGIVVETTVQVYPMPRILGGFINYAWDDAESVLLKLQELLDGKTEHGPVPDAACMQIGFMNGRWGMGISLIFIWADSSTLETEGRRWLEIVRGLGTVTFDTVKETTFKDFQNVVGAVIDEPVNVYTRCFVIPKWTPKTVDVLLNATRAIPKMRKYNIGSHIGHGKHTRENATSCFPYRKPHILFHINACDDTDKMDEAKAWVEKLVADLVATGEGELGVYVSFMGEDEQTKQSFADNWDQMRAIKAKVDTNNLFQFAQPRLAD